MTTRKESDSVKKEERDFTRVSFIARVEIVIQGQTICGNLTDVSMSGIYLHEDVCAGVDEPCEVRIYLGEDDSIMIHALGSVVRSDEGGLAVNFKGLYCDSYAHLKKIVLFNASNGGAVESEMEAHFGIGSNK